jgi:hypothetical protein
MTRRVTAKGLLLFVLVPSAGSAGAETSIGATTSLTAGYSSDPVLAGSGSSQTGTATATATIAPRVSLTSPTNKFLLSGALDYTAYNKTYQDVTNWRLNTDFNQSLSAVSSASVSASLNSTQNIFYATPSEDGQIPPGGISAEEIGQRVESYLGRAGFNTQFSGGSALRANATYVAQRYADKGLLRSDSDTVSAGVDYSHVLSGKLAATAGAFFSHIAYDLDLFGSSDVARPYVGLVWTPDSRVSLTVNAGVDFSSLTNPAGHVNSRNLYGLINVCRKGLHTSLCGTVSRSVQTSGFNGTSQETTITMSYSQVVSVRGNFNVNGSYSENKGLQALLGSQLSTSNILISAGYYHRINPRLSGVVLARYLNRISSREQTGTNIMGSIGLSYQLGR